MTRQETSICTPGFNVDIVKELAGKLRKKKNYLHGSLTQLVECLLCKQDVGSSILPGSTTKPPGCSQPGGFGFPYSIHLGCENFVAPPVDVRSEYPLVHTRNEQDVDLGTHANETCALKTDVPLGNDL